MLTLLLILITLSLSSCSDTPLEQRPSVTRADSIPKGSTIIPWQIVDCGEAEIEKEQP